MAVRGFDHYNLRAARPMLDELRDFYRDVVGLTVGDRPPFRRFGYWLYSGEQRRAAPELGGRRRGTFGHGRQHVLARGVQLHGSRRVRAALEVASAFRIARRRCRC